MSGLSDRKVRRIIENSTREADIVINIDNGYFRYLDERDIPYMESYYKREMSRGWSSINKCRVIRKFLTRVKKNAGNAECSQINLFDWAKEVEECRKEIT